MILGRCTRDSFPSPVFRLAIAYGIENTSACCSAVWITASGSRPDHLFGTADRKRGGEPWHSPSSAAVVVLLGWLLITSGIVQGLSLIGARQVPHFWLQLISVRSAGDRAAQGLQQAAPGDVLGELRDAHAGHDATHVSLSQHELVQRHVP